MRYDLKDSQVKTAPPIKGFRQDTGGATIPQPVLGTPVFLGQAA